MDVIYGLIPLMIILGLGAVVLFIWTVRSGQYDDLDGDSSRILTDDDDPNLPENMKNSNMKDKKRDKRNWPDAD